MSGRKRSSLAAEYRQAANEEARRAGASADLLLLHYTGMTSAAAAIDWLTRADSRVSCHYLVDEHGRITQMVEEDRRAWHAGLASWQGVADINSASIGIEIHNPGHELGYPPFAAVQMTAVEALCRDIAVRHGIRRERVLAHSDVAPARKADPGERFDWARLARAGIGLWVAPAAIAGDAGLGAGDHGPAVRALQRALSAFGYGLPATGSFDVLTQQTVTAFQRHWRQARVDGRWDRSCAATLAALSAERQRGGVA